MPERADILLSALGYAKSRTHAASLIKSGLVSVNGKTVSKPSESIDENSTITISDGGCPYVSRGGLKLKAALDGFSVNVSGLVALDIGASTGGFTDCLLREGAKKVFAVDVGTGQLDSSLLSDSRVKSYEKINARNLESDFFGTLMDIIVMDVSFISQTLIYPTVSRLISPTGVFISLIKPQFELGRQALNRHGIVRDAEKRFPALREALAESALLSGLELCGTIKSPVTGGDGNTEYLALFRTVK